MLAVFGLTLAGAPAKADDWMPHPANAQWQYDWSDSVYNPAGTIENVVVQQQQGSNFTLAWADRQDTPPPAGATSITCLPNADVGTMSFQDTNSGVINTDWNSCPPPVGMPILCASPTGCSNSLSSTLYTLIWGDRVPVLSEPLLQGTTWNATGGADGSAASSSQYLGMRLVKVPAFPNGVSAAVVVTNVAQSGALGDPFGTGVRTVWWVLRRWPREDCLRPHGRCQRPDHQRKPALDEPEAAGATARRRLLPASTGPEGHLPVGQQETPGSAGG